MLTNQRHRWSPKEYRPYRISSEVTRQITTSNSQNNKIWDWGKNRMSRVTTLYYLKCPVWTTKKNYETGKGTGKYGPYTGKKNQSLEPVHEETQTLNIDKDFKSAI